MNIVDHFAQNHAHLLYLVFGVTLIIELTVMGLSGPLLFIALGSLFTAILISLGVLSGWEAELFCLGVSTGVIALLAWKPLRKFQNQEIAPDTSSDMIGRRVACVDTITKTSGSIRHSGVNWPARLDQSLDITEINAQQTCEIVSVDGNTMIVIPA